VVDGRFRRQIRRADRDFIIEDDVTPQSTAGNVCRGKNAEIACWRFNCRLVNNDGRLFGWSWLLDDGRFARYFYVTFRRFGFDDRLWSSSNL
jgi:hypothetical protein